MTKYHVLSMCYR